MEAQGFIKKMVQRSSCGPNALQLALSDPWLIKFRTQYPKDREPLSIDTLNALRQYNLIAQQKIQCSLIAETH